MRLPWKTPQDMSVANSTYEADFCQWADQQMEIARKGNKRRLEPENIALALSRVTTEITMGLNRARNEQLVFMLALVYQHRDEESRNDLIIEILLRRLQIRRMLTESPSLKENYDRYFHMEYQVARRAASINTGIPLSTFPETCPWTSEQVEDVNFLPD